MGRRLFYREAGPADAPAVVLLHGFPTSSFMFRDLIPLLADRYHVIAPDHLGFGLSDAPPVDEFDYTFDALADLTAGLLDQLGVDPLRDLRPGLRRPVGWRLALRRPGRGHRDHHPERQRLRGRLRRRSSGQPVLGVLRASRTPSTEAGRPRRP